MNPKVNNLVKGYNASQADIIWILDSNCRTDPSVLTNAVQYFANPIVGLVHHAPCGVGLLSLGAYLDGVYLNCTHTRMYTTINSTGIASCIIGKSNLFRKRDLEAIGGLAQFGKYMAEDNMIGLGLMNLGRTHQIAPDFAYQSLGNVSITDFISRRVRWIRIRKYAVTLATLYEPLTECLVCGILGGLAFKYFYDFNFILFSIMHWCIWFLSDMLTAKVSYGSRQPGRPWDDFGSFAFAWLCLQLVVLPSYIYAMMGTEILWRNQYYKLNMDGTVKTLVYKGE
jgi:ceramide glucosyltransferase